MACVRQTWTKVLAPVSLCLSLSVRLLAHKSFITGLLRETRSCSWNTWFSVWSAMNTQYEMASVSRSLPALSPLLPSELAYAPLHCGDNGHRTLIFPSIVAFAVLFCSILPPKSQVSFPTLCESGLSRIMFLANEALRLGRSSLTCFQLFIALWSRGQ